MTRIQAMLMSLAAFAATTMSSTMVLASEGGDSAGGSVGMMALAVAIGIAIAAAAGAFGQSRAAAAALEGISRNPNAADKVFVPMILGLAFIESLVLFTWVLMFLLLGKF